MATALVANQGAGWRAQLGAKLVTAEEAVSHIKTGDRICLALAQSTPLEVCTALVVRLMELENIVLNAGATAFNWDLPGLGERFTLQSMYLSPYDRHIYTRGDGDFTPIQYYRAGHLPPSLEGFNVYSMLVSPPDENGMCNFGDSQIMSKLLAREADLVIAEIDSNLIRVGGDNSIHISEIDYLVERTMELPEISLPEPNEDEKRQISAVCGAIAKELVPDRASIQIGVGSMSGQMMKFLHNHHDLGMQTEIIPHHTAPLVEAGVLTGRYKKLFPGQVVGSGIAPLTPRAELDYIDGNPTFALYDFNFTDDIRTIAQEDGLISINNAMAVDLTGHVNGESIGPVQYTGTGGQTAFVVGASLAGGKTILVTPSYSTVKGQRVSRIVPTMPSGSVVTCPRAFVHYVVTEYGIATLKGKSLRERIGEMIAIAHPDFRSELKSRAKLLYNL
jgi:4-hydroxybutyrate CoA-transferase